MHAKLHPWTYQYGPFHADDYVTSTNSTLILYNKYSSNLLIT